MHRDPPQGRDFFSTGPDPNDEYQLDYLDEVIAKRLSGLHDYIEHLRQPAMKRWTDASASLHKCNKQFHEVKKALQFDSSSEARSKRILGFHRLQEESMNLIDKAIGSTKLWRIFLRDKTTKASHSQGGN